MRWHLRRHAAMQAHAERVAAADREVQLSRDRLAEAHEQVIDPLRAAAERNNFATMIAQSLAKGHHH